ncbi:MAG TPA: preprotein translocase subunit SecE [Bacillota bacterium]|nr:preprotein translocase subunit SecE [Bacillota bacterium]
MKILKRIARYLHDIRVELRKVHWPTRREFMVFTGIVIATVVVIGVLFFGLDNIFLYIVRLIIG